MASWDERFLDMATLVGSWSKDPSTRVGAVITRPDRTVVSVGYNGFPRGVDDSPKIYADRAQKLMRVVHAEANAILNSREPLAGCHLYVSPLHPCASCAGMIIQSGIVRIVYRMAPERQRQWAENFAAAARMFREAGVHTHCYP